LENNLSLGRKGQASIEFIFLVIIILVYLHAILLPTVNYATAAANDKAIYVYVVPWFYDGSSWTPGADGGTATLPSGTEGTYTIGATHNLRPGTVIGYTATGQVVNKSFTLTNVGDGFSLVIINYTGAAIAASANVVQYKPVHYTSA